MKVILLQDVKKQGKKDDVLDVNDGYAQNFLIKNGLAVKYTEGSKKHLDNQIEDRNQKEAELIKDCEVIKNNIENNEISFKVKVGKEGKLFGSISSKQIYEELGKLGIKIAKKNIIIDHAIDTLGIHIVKITLHKKVIAKLKIVVQE